MLLCNTTNKCCIGSSLDLRNRMKTYYSVNVRKREDRLIHRAIEKYGEDNFSRGGRAAASLTSGGLRPPTSYHLRILSF